MTIHENCLKCKLYEGCKSPFMPGSGPANPVVLLCGEAPGETEDLQGEPFVGRSGKLLREALAAVDFEDNEVGFTNTVRCRPPENRTPKAKEIGLCSVFLADELEQRKPDVVMLLGNAPLKAVLGQSGIMNWNGQIVEREGIVYIPAYHPAYILRNGGNSELLEDWLSAFSKARELVTGKEFQKGDEHFQYFYPNKVSDLWDMRDEILKFKGLVAADVESISVNIKHPGNKIVSIAFAIDGKAWSFPLDHKDNDWTDDDWEAVILPEILEPILTRCKIIGHNVKFDCKIIRYLLGIDFQPYGDTLQLHRLLNAHHLEHGLKRLAGMYLQMFDYDKELTDYIAEHDDCNYRKGGHYGNIPLPILLPYGGMDVAATWMLHDQLFPQLTDKQKDLYLEMVMPADYALGVMEEHGIKLDAKLIKRYKTIYEKIKDDYYKKLLHYPYVQDYVEVISKDKPKFNFNPNSALQMSAVLYGCAGFTPPGFTDTGNPSIKRVLLKETMYDIETGAVEIADDALEMLKTYMDWKLLSSVLSKTFKPMLESPEWMDPDGRVRSTYILGGAKTGRSASRNPNLQNIPTPEKEPGTILQYLPVKNVFTYTHKGGCLCMIDYSGMELRVMASVAGIQGMVDTFAAGGDVHRYVSSLIYGIPQEEINKFQRYRGKWCNWSLLYLGNWWTLYRLYRINGLTEDEAKRITNLYFEAFPELPTYHKNTIAFVEEHKYVESPFGRILHLPAIDHREESIRKDVQRTAVNMPIQGTASDTLMAALAVINYYMQEEKMKTMLVNTVHDSLVADVYPGELEDFQDLCVDVMENITDYAEDFMPHLDFSWLKVPLKADVDIGTHYGTYGMPKELTCEKCGGHGFEFCREQTSLVEYRCKACGELLEIPFDADSSSFKMLYNETQPVAVSVTKKLQQHKGALLEIERN